jgi:hypothetical protein
MPFDQVMSKFKKGTLHSGSKKGPKVGSRDQALAIMMSEKKEAAGGKGEYAAAPGKKPNPFAKKGAPPFAKKGKGKGKFKSAKQQAFELRGK